MITEKKGRTTVYKCGKRFETKEEKEAREKRIKEAGGKVTPSSSSAGNREG